MATDIMHRQVAPVKANEHGSEPSGTKIHKIGATRPTGKAELRTIVDSSTRFRDLRPASQCVYRVLLSFAGPFERDCDGNEVMFARIYGGQADIAERAGVDVRTVRRSLKQLAEAGLVVAGQEPGFPYRRDAYTIIVPREVIDEYLTRVQDREQAKAARREQRSTSGTSGQNVRNIRADCPEQPDKMSASSSIHQKNPSEESTTTEAPRTQTTRAASTNAVHGGGGVHSRLTEEEKTEARKILQGWGVTAWPNVMQRLERGEISVDDIKSTGEYMAEQIDLEANRGRVASIGGGLFYEMLLVPSCVESRRVWAEQRRSENSMREAARIRRENAEREASAERHRLVNVVAAAGVEADSEMNKRADNPEAVEKIQKNMERIGRELGSTAEAIVDRLSESHRVEIADDPEPWRVFKRLANIAKNIESERAQAKTMRAEFKNRTAQGVAQ